jgi:hypothetical protein
MGLYEEPWRRTMNTAMIIPIMRDGGFPKTPGNQLPFWSGQGVDVEEWTPSWPAPTIRDVLVPTIQTVLNVYNGSLDYDRVTIAGYSEGGGGAVVAALAYPDVFNMVVASSAIFLRNYATAAMAGERRLAADPSRKRRLQTIMISKGLTDQWPFEGYPSDMEQLHLHWPTDHESLRHYNVEIRLYKGVGHWAWYNDWIKCPKNYFTFWSNQCKPETCIISAKIDHLAKLSHVEGQNNEADLRGEDISDTTTVMEHSEPTTVMENSETTVMDTTA